MKNPRWKPNGIINIVCFKFLVMWWRFNLKYRFHRDTTAYIKYCGNKYWKKMLKSKGPTDFNNAKYGGKHGKRN
jgi:hypothetical protein